MIGGVDRARHDREPTAPIEISKVSIRLVLGWTREEARMLAGTVQDSIGERFGVSGGVVLAVLIFGGLLLVAWLSDEKKKRDQRQAVESGAGVLASKHVTTVRSSACASGRHDQCAGQAVGRACTCTCHTVAMSSFCGDLGRHDLCPGAVVVANIGAAPCGCTCHIGHTTQDRTQRVIDAPATGSSGPGHAASPRPSEVATANKRPVDAGQVMTPQERVQNRQRRVELQRALDADARNTVTARTDVTAMRHEIARLDFEMARDDLLRSAES